MTQERAYRFYLSKLCYELGKLAVMQQEITAGNSISAEVLTETLERVREYKRGLLKAKEDAGLPGGLSFLEDNRFAGFSMEGGVLTGDRTFLYKIVTPWLNEYPNGDVYRYEVANLVVAYELAEEDMRKTAAPAVTKKPTRRVKKRTSIKERLLNLLAV